MPAPLLEQRDICEWIEEPWEEDEPIIREDLWMVTAASALEESAKRTLQCEAYPKLYSGLRCLHDEVGFEQRAQNRLYLSYANASRDDLKKAADALAALLGISRSQLDMALAHFIEEPEEAKILEEFNEAYGGEMEQEDREFLNHAKDYRRRRFSTRK